jgi:peptidoglycan/xylan/chitin deacetylase (PgdA/CDA1 family)
MRLWSMAPKGGSVRGWRSLGLRAAPSALLWGLVLLASWPVLALARRLLPPLLPEVLFCAPGAGRRLALTIDDGPSPASDQLLDLLRELQVPATLFLIGDHLERGPAGFVARALAGGHLTGNHMQVDGVSARLDGACFAAQLRHTERLLQVPMRWFRPGGGWFHRRMLRQLQAAGYRLALGSVFPLDTNHPPGWFLRRFLLLNAHPGAVIVLHDRPDTLPATLHTLRQVVPLLQRRGYRFVTLDGLERPGPARDPGEPA